METQLLRIVFHKMWKILVCSKRLYGTQRQVFAVLIVVSVFVYTTVYFTISGKPTHIIGFNDTHRMVQNRLKESVLEEKGTGCNMPVLDPFSEEATRFDEPVPNIRCKGTDWVNCHKSECSVTKNILKNMRDVSCIYKDIIYLNDQLYIIGDPTKVVGDDKYILNRSDHVKVSCKGMDIHSLGIVSSRWYGYKAGFRPVKIPPVPPHRKDSYNVMILAFDSTSRNGFFRKMPKSYKYLLENAVILDSYNIVGDGTPAALYPILTGMAEEENPDARKKTARDQFVNAKLFIFHHLKRYGYRTAYFEDMPWIGTFQFRFNGFRRQPADHYLRAFFQVETKHGLKEITGYHTRHCIGAVPQFQMMLNLSDEVPVFCERLVPGRASTITSVVNNWLQLASTTTKTTKIFLKLDGKKFCFTFIADITHENFNLITMADEPLVSFLQGLSARRMLEDTLIIIMGDHGARFNKIRDTYQGKLEERLPLMAIMLPEKLKRLRPGALAALQQNKKVLTTPFDIHTTLLDVLDLKDQSNPYTISGSDLPRAMSLLDPIPKTRSCGEAGVMPHWCACTKWFNVSESYPIYLQVANVLADFIDKYSEEQRSKCAKRSLVSVAYVLQRNVNNDLLKFGHKKEIDSYLGNPTRIPPKAHKEYYQAKIVMSPGRGVFEGTVVYNTNADLYTISHKDISRVNAYGDEPSCVSANYPHLNKYCYCKDRLPKQLAALNESRNSL